MRYIYLFILSFYPIVLFGQSIIPMPQQIVSGQGSISLQSLAALYEAMDQQIQRDDNRIIRHDNNTSLIQRALPNTVKIETITELINENPEAYELKIEPNQITITGGPAGIFYAKQSLLQLIFHSKGSLSCQTIRDEPRFKWRGAHLDVSRHFFSIEVVKKYIDVLAMHKMNVFHWHLTDDQGWRIEIKKYPKLTQKGAWRKETMIDKNFDPYKGDGIPHGGFYTQEQIKEVVAYAQERFITVVPEIEMPGHSMAALSAYPQYSCQQKNLNVRTTWGVSNDIYCSTEETFDFIFGILDEVLELFPSKYIHIGGDEAPKTRWKACSKCQATMQKNNLKDEHALQSYFIKKIDAYLTAQGRNTIGWDEILEGGLAPNAAVMSWRGEKGGIAAARQKHKVVMSPGSHCYFDHYQGNKKTEPLAIGGYTPVKKVYSYEPIPQELSAADHQYVLGAQANLWTEYIQSPAQLFNMALPRLSALSEVLWTQPQYKNYSQFIDRLIPHFALLHVNRFNYSSALFDVEANEIAKNNKLMVSLSNDVKKYDIRYTIDGSKPTASSNLYKAPISIAQNTLLQAASFNKKWPAGKILSQQYINHLATAKKIKLRYQPKSQYSNGGALTLVNGIKGSLPWSGNEWLGWRGKEHMEATIDLGSPKKISKVRVSFLYAPESWIQLPQAASLFIKDRNGDYKQYELNKWNADGTLQGEINTTARYIKLSAYPMEKIPDRFAGAGQAAWMFVSEIIVE